MEGEDELEEIELGLRARRGPGVRRVMRRTDRSLPSRMYLYFVFFPLFLSFVSFMAQGMGVDAGDTPL